jgi:hypothetical protein
MSEEHSKGTAIHLTQLAQQMSGVPARAGSNFCDLR